MDSLFVGLRVVVSLGAVLALLWVISRKVSKSGRVTRSAKHVTVVARQGISGKASVAVVDVEGTRYVLGVTEHQVTVLGAAEAPQDARVTTLAPAIAAPAAPVAPSFETALASARDAAPAAVVAPAAAPLGERRAARAVAPQPTSALAGSILSAGTWKQAAAAMRSHRRA